MPSLYGWGCNYADSGLWRGNEPVGMTLFAERPFAAENEGGWAMYISGKN